MLLKSIILGTTNWLRSRRYETVGDCGPALDDEGLLTDELDGGPLAAAGHDDGPPRRRTSVQAMTTVERRDSVEKIQEGFNCLVSQLQQINGHLNRQLEQHEELMDRVRQLPQLLESLPLIVDNQRQLTDQLFGQLRATDLRQEQFLDAVERIPTETSRQTRTLQTIHDQLQASAQTEVELASCVDAVGHSLDRLDSSTAGNTEEMRRVRKSAAARDRYLAYALSKFRRRVIWLFAGFGVLCMAVMSLLIGLIVYSRL